MRKFYIFLIILSIFLALFAPFLSKYDPVLIELNVAKIAPNFTHIFGTDILGRDIFSRTLYALRISLFVGVSAAFLSVIFALAYVFISRFFAYAFFSRILDMLLALPSLLVIMFFQSFLSGSLWSMIFIIALGHFAFIAKVIDNQLNKFQKLEFYQNAIILGSTKTKALFSDLLPACLNLIFVLFVLHIAHSITAEATLSFFGLGVELSTPSLGNMLNDANKAVFLGFWWMIVFPVVFILLLILPLLALANDTQEDIKI
ncbi:ABC transporter permease [Campylobacter insulaenigrae]|uniref:ABC transporter permease n=1 Tax=Campylobacter insulaenigrae TaxID=260714 RepID=UPI00215278A4|nr:ABC transporter permease [Campylobacter insulaenigrae]MCR6573952.1 ABC transporter permease [Campylobacter insulaenigrae]MCR6580192.1 ABC transporter permease [Campylobacter insulaenigrae]MCR6584993.1 ABC transporter permease [Campylobacter insulaenigrae]MCR6586848.1 ABC transporter permease [Campylobacter insulaenigrae]